MLKPIGFSDFLRSANRAAQQKALSEAKNNPTGEGGKLTEMDQEGYLFVKADYKMLRIDINKILYVESQSEYIRIYLDNDKPIMTLLSMKALEERLLTDRFMRVHRSYLVNLKKVIRIGRASVTLEGGQELPLARGKYDDVNRAFIQRN